MLQQTQTAAAGAGAAVALGALAPIAYKRLAINFPAPAGRNAHKANVYMATV